MEGFDFTRAIGAVCKDMASRVPLLRHIDMARVAIGFRQSRNPGVLGVQASLTPLRFPGGAATGLLRGRRYTCQRVMGPDGEECLYLLNFYLPRFLDLPLEEKLTTVAHELWHIGPEFDGDLRRHGGRCYAHGSSQRAFDAHAASLARQWLAADPPERIYAFLTQRYAELVAEHGPIRGRRYRAPRLAPSQE